MRCRTFAWLMAFLLVVSGLAAAQQQYGTITGTVSDEQGGVLPGATVSISSSALIGGTQTVVAGASGAYTFRNLLPGSYDLQFEMSGFSTLRREEIIVSVARVTNVNAELRVGAVAETITVTGESPVVDVRQNITSTNIDADIYEAIPTARNPWTMAGLVPGMITGQLDVGGNRGMQQYSLEVSGSADSQKSFSIDGLKVNWPGGAGGFTMQYYDFGMYEEYNFQTSAMTAESGVAGVYMNMVTKSGGNDLSGTQSAYFANDSMQGENVDETQAALGGNPIINTYDLQGTLGGPIVQDKAWFFGAGRWWRLDQFLPGTEGLGEGGGPTIDDNRITNAMGKATFQVSDRDKMFVMLNKNWKYRYHRDRTPGDFVGIEATSFQKQPAQNFVASWDRLVGTSALLNVRFGRMWGETPYFYQEGIDRDDTRSIPIHDTVTGTFLRSAPNETFNPNHRNQFNASLSYFLDQASAAHDLKLGVSYSTIGYANRVTRIFDTLLEATDGVSDQAILYDTPTVSNDLMSDWSFFIQDALTIGQKMTLNLGVRFDGVSGNVPAQAKPAGVWSEASTFAPIDNVPQWNLNVAPRLGISYDIFGDGRTAFKAYYGRTYAQTGTQYTSGVNPVSGSEINVPWNDLNGDLFLTPGPSGTIVDSPELDLTRLTQVGFVGGLSDRFDPDAKRPYSDLFDIGFEHEVTTDVSVGARYIRRQHRRGLARIDLNRPSSAYSPMAVTYDDPVDGPNQTITVFDLDPAFLGARDRLITNVDVLESDYNGVTFDVRKRMSDNWQLLGGFTFGSHKGFNQSSGYYTAVDFNNPNTILNRDDGSVFTDLAWTATFSGSYIFPHDIVLAGKYTGRDGLPKDRTLRVSGLTQGSETIRVVQRGVDRAESFTNFVDLSFSKKISVGQSAFVEPVIQIFNIFNAATVQDYRDRIGSSWGNPTQLLAPRLLRIGIKWVF